MKAAILRSSFYMKSRMYVTIFLSLFLTLIEGTDLTWSSPMLKKLGGLEDNPLKRRITSDESSLLASLPILGSIFGSFLIMGVTQKIGRKPLLTMHGIASLFCYITLAFSTNIWLYYVARLVSGLNSAAIAILVPMYICELADPESRGMLAAGIIVSMNLGILIPYSIGPYMPFFWYHLCLSLLPISFMVLFSIFGLESPYYYLQSDPSQAEELLKILKGGDDVSETLQEMKRCFEDTSEDNFFAQLRTRGTRKAVVIGLGLVTFSMCSGPNTIIAYSQLIFDIAGGNWSGEVDTIIVGSVQFTVSVFSYFIMDKFGRKLLLSASATFCGIFMGALSLYLIARDNGMVVQSLGWLPLISFLGFVSSYNMGLGPLWLTVLGELFPLNVKNAAMSVCGLWSAILQFLLTLVFQRVSQLIGLGGALIFFAIMALTTAAFVMIFLVETKGKTLEQIQDELNNSNHKK